MRAPMTPAREVRKLKAEVKRLRRALAPFANFQPPHAFDDAPGDSEIYITQRAGQEPTSLTMGDLRRARAAMKEGR